MAVGVTVNVGVIVGVGVSVGVSVTVGVRVIVGVCVGVALGVCVGVSVGVGVGEAKMASGAWHAETRSDNKTRGIQRLKSLDLTFMRSSTLRHRMSPAF